MTKDKKKIFNKILTDVEGIVQGSRDRDVKLHLICKLLHISVDYYDWVGFYLVDSEKERQLVLGPYVGEPTDHTCIAFGQGICGQAAEQEETFVIQDVSKEDNYLSCSIAVKSEIVLPVFKNGNIVGELDIDSHQLAPFTDEDREYLEKICGVISPLF